MAEQPIRLPEELTRRARAIVTGDDSWDPPQPRDAATIALLRDGVAGPEVFVLRRVRTMAFAAGMHVFPGGALEAGDVDPAVPWRPSSVWDDAEQAARVSATPDVARGLVVAAVRETFEECGVLLAVDDAGSPPRRDAQDPHELVDWEAARVDVLEGRRGFAEVLAARGLAVDPALVPAWGHWVTPAVETRRFDTRFYVAALPAGQQAHDVGGEADRVRWVRPTEALAAYGRGEMAMLPPTVATLSELAAFDTAAAAVAAGPDRRTRPLLPHPHLGADGEVVWNLVDARTGEVISAASGEPAGSEVHGVRGAAGGGAAGGAGGDDRVVGGPLP